MSMTHTCFDVECFEFSMCAIHLFWINNINQWFNQCDIFDTTHIELIHIVPPVDFLFLK